MDDAGIGACLLAIAIINAANVRAVSKAVEKAYPITLRE